MPRPSSPHRLQTLQIPPLPNSALPASSPAAALSPAVRNQVYAEREQGRLLLDLYRPVRREHAGLRPDAAARAEVAAPTVLWFHPGGFRSGSKDIVPIDWLTRCGFNVVSVAYRLVPGTRYPGQVEDAVDALRYLRAHAGRLHLCPCRFVAAGMSAGAYLASMAALAGPRHRADAVSVRGVINLAGFSDFMALQTLPSRRERVELLTPEARLLGQQPVDRPELALEASPIHHVTPASPPFLHIHGERDEIIPLDQTRRFHNALKRRGVPSKMVVLKGLRHHVKKTLGNEGVQDRMLRFVRERLSAPVTEAEAAAAEAAATAASAAEAADAADVVQPEGRGG